MSIEAILMTALGGPLAKFLLKKYLSDPAEGVAGGLLDIAKARIGAYGDQRQAQREFERLGERIAARLVPLFEREAASADMNIAAVANELAVTLEGRVSADFFVARDLDPARLTAALREARPVEKGPFSAAEVALYDRALVEVVRYVVQIASRLPKFELAFAAASLQRLGRMSDDLEEALDTVRRIERAVMPLAARSNAADERSARYEADYRQAVARNLDYLELFGADISPESRRHALSVAYISLNLKKPTGTGGETESLPVEMVLDSLRPGEGRLLVRGEAGSGKSTLSRWSAIQSASLQRPLGERGLGDAGREELPALPSTLAGSGTAAALRGEKRMQGDEGHSWRKRIPFLLLLRNCTDGQLPSPDEFPAHIASEVGNPPEDWVVSVLREGRALVLLDGVDEVPNAHREQLRRGIEAIVGAYPDNYFVASTRPTAVDEGWLAAAGFREATVDPMSEVDRTRFIRRWHEAVGQELVRLGRPDPKLPEVASALIEQLPEHPPVARLATNPLLCAMICALHRERSQKLPESQAELCEAVCQMLLHRREREGGLSLEAFPEAYRALTYPEKRAIVQDIAHYMVRNGESTIARERARQSVEDSLKQFPDRRGIDAGELLKLIVERSGVLRETRPGQIDFIHNTLKEYLAAERFADAGDAGQLADRYRDASWQPVIFFAVATNRREFATEVVRRVLSPPQADERLQPEELRARRLFALRCRAAALHLAPELIAELDSVVGNLFPPRSMAEAEALASAADAAVEHLHSRKGLKARVAAACVRTLRLIGTRRAGVALRSYLNDRRETVVSELAQAVAPLEIEAIRDLLRGGIPLPDAVRAQIADLGPLRDLDLSSLDLGGTQVSDLAPLSGLTSLQSLDLSQTQVSDLAPLSGLTSLQSLDLSQTQVSDLAPLAGLTSLQSLNLSRTQVSDLTPLAGLTSLQSFNLSQTQVSDLAPLAGLTSLQSLVLWATPVSDLAPLAGLASLQLLDIMGTPVSDLVPLAGLTSLQSLDLWITQVNDLAPLAGLTSLESLDLRGMRVSNLAPLAGLTSLLSLDLGGGTPVSDLTPLARLTSLQSLGFEDTQVSDLTPLAGLTSLQSLDLGSTQVNDLTPLAGLTSLQSLVLGGTQVNDLTPLAGLTSLQSLHLREAQVSDLTPLVGLTSLRSLGLEDTQVSDLTPLADLTSLQLLYLATGQAIDLAPLAGLTALRVRYL